MLENQPNAGGAPLGDDLDLELAAVNPSGGQPVKQEETPAEIPEKYKNKSVDDLVRMHQNLEREYSRQGNELGQIRRLSDQLISLRPENTQKPEKKPVTVEALLDNPEKALSDVLDSSPVAQVAQQANQRIDDLERKAAFGDFARAHPDYQKDVQDPEFIEWVKKNPHRAELAARADKYDFNAANSLWGMWDEYQDLKGARKVEEGNDIATKVGTVRATPASPTQKSGPVYSRAKLMDLRVRAASGDRSAQDRLADPEFQRKLNAAYEEGRVR